MRTNGLIGTWCGYIQGQGGVYMCHPACEAHPGQGVDFGETEVALDSELSVWASVGFTSVVVREFCVSIAEPSDVNGCGAEARDQAREFISALEQEGHRFAVGHRG